MPFAIGGPAASTLIQAEDYDTGGEGVAYHDLTAANSGGSYRTGAGNGVDLKPIAGTTNQYRISDGVAGEWVEYSVDVATAGQYTIEFRVANRDPGSAFHLEMNGLGMASNLTGSVAVPDTNSFDTFTTVTRTVTLVAGPQVFRFVIDANAPASGYGPSLDWMRVTPAAP